MKINSKLLVIHTALAPYRVDFFKALNNKFELDLYFLNENLWRRNYNQIDLKNQIGFNVKFLSKGLNFKKRPLYRKGLFKILNSYKRQTILLSEFSFITFCCVLLNCFLNLRNKVYVISDDSPDYFNNSGSIRILFKKIILNHINGLILSNKEVLSFYESRYNDIELIYFPIIRDETTYITKVTYKNRFFDFIYVGRLSDEKNVVTLVKEFSIFNIKNNNKYSLLIVGDGPTYKQLLDVITFYNQQTTVVFKGWIEGDLLKKEYFNSKVLILPSLKEAFGAVINEALLCGCLVLCSKFAGGKDLIKNNSNGIVFDPTNTEIFQNSLNKIIQMPNNYANNMVYSFSFFEKKLQDFLLK